MEGFSGMVVGHVKWFNAKKGYGFIEAEGNEYFIHHTGINSDGFKTLEENEQVEFEVTESERGPKATNVVRCDGVL